MFLFIFRNLWTILTQVDVSYEFSSVIGENSSADAWNLNRLWQVGFKGEFSIIQLVYCNLLGDVVWTIALIPFGNALIVSVYFVLNSR